MIWTGPNDAPLSTKEERMDELKRTEYRLQRQPMAEAENHLARVCCCLTWARVRGPNTPDWLPLSNHHENCPAYEAYTYMVLELDGTRCVMTMLEGEAALHAEPDHEYKVSTVQMTEDQFASLQDFAGF